MHSGVEYTGEDTLEHCDLGNALEPVFTLLSDDSHGQRDTGEGADQGKSQAGGPALISIQTAGKQKTDSCAKCDSGSGDEHDFWEAKFSFDHLANALSLLM